MLALLGHSGRVRGGAGLTLTLQWVVMALQFNRARGQGHVMCPLYIPVDLHPLGIQPILVGMFAVIDLRGYVDHIDVRDAGLPQDQL